MSPPADEPIASVGELLVHALELEHEASERFAQLADTMALHHNGPVAALFRDLSRRATGRAAALGARARGITLPRIPPWSFKWDCPDAPAADCLDAQVSYRMTAAEALRATIYNETRAHVFYAQVAATSPDPQAAGLALELAAEQVRHLDALDRRLALEAADALTPPTDLDPPHVPG